MVYNVSNRTHHASDFHAQPGGTFLFLEFFMYQYPKQILTIAQQIQSYIDAGMTISSYGDVEKTLKSVGFYRLRGYSFQLYDNYTKKYVQGTKFEDILKLYQFDQELSILLFSMISKIEVALRVRLVEALLVYGDALILQDSSIFKEKRIYWQNLSTIAAEIARSNDVFIKHNYDKHEGEIPLWAVVEVLSFGTLSKIIKNLKTGAGSAYSILAANYQYSSKKGNLVTPSQKMFTSWVQGVSVLRNMCAHNSRIYNRTINTTPEILDRDKISPQPTHNGLYQILLAMKYLRSSDEEWTVFVDNLNTLFQNNSSVISLAAMNFPTDWKVHLSV
jgi:abortive infection bacteriophage resistance protein